METKANGWYAARGSGGQGIVIEEGTGRNVAVTYEEKDAPLAAAAPDMAELLERLGVFVAAVESRAGRTMAEGVAIRALLAKIKGESNA